MEIPIKTRLLIFLNNFKNQLTTMVSDIEAIVGKSESEYIIFNLANDIVSIPLFFDKGRDDEYEWLMGFISYSYLLSSNKYDNSFYLNLINKWDTLDYESKSTYFSLINKQKSPITILNSIQDLIKLNSIGKLSDSNSSELINKVESLILKFVEYIISIDKFISETEEEKLLIFKKIISSSKILQIEIDYLEYLNNKFNEISYVNENNKVDLSEPDEIRGLILQNQDKITSIDRKYILEFLKLHKYLASQKELIYKSIEILKLQNDTHYIDEWIGVIKNQIGSYNVVYLNTINMIVCLCENELVVFYELYETFDGLGVFKTNYEKEVLESLTSISSNINSLNKNIVHKLMLIEHQLKNISLGLNELNLTMHQNIQAINNLEDSIVSSFKSLETSIGNNFNQLSQNISGHLAKIESGIAYNNLISTVNAYQLYNINKQTKPLLSN